LSVGVANAKKELDGYCKRGNAKRLKNATRFNETIEKIDSEIGRHRVAFLSSQTVALQGRFMGNTAEGFATIQRSVEDFRVGSDNQITGIRTIVEELAARSGGIPTSPIDTFNANFSATVNPVCAVLNPGDPLTLEGKLKAAALRLGDDDVRAIGATGMGGIGKTWPLKTIATDLDIKDRLTGGVYFMTFGRGATSENICGQLSLIVESCGGNQLAAEIAACTLTSIAVKNASSWFEARRCLFICDDLWETISDETR
jgi:hypothetical protein